ncbi:MAG TPA: hypothetical protein DCK93_02855 [Blastocatellia bacterium]|jgi:hypothetical protein|nr:hypothetical protein [Blastocatellia bacterium]HAF21844.1 hypothetical protein [Blastocatellia bacterium]
MRMKTKLPPRMRNFHYWIHCSKTVFRREIAVLRKIIDERLLPTFASIEKEADAVSDEAWKSYNTDAGPDSDPGMAAEAAHDAGVCHYIAMVDAKQGLLNLFAVALHHLVEQQQFVVLRQEFDARAPWTLCEFVKRLDASAIKVKKFSSWDDITELRKVANTAKHAEGKSAEWLRNHRPEIFTPTCLRAEAQLMQRPNRWLFQPLSGQDLFVTADDLRRYFRAAESFWLEFEEALTSKAQDAI